MIIGHKTQWQFLKKMAENNEIPQAFLFSGPDSLGKKKVAFEFIKMLNCEAVFQNKVSREPCQNCSSCNLIEKKKHPDLIVLEPKGKEIQISQIRELKRFLSFRPQVSHFKSVIIDEAQTLNLASQNCLLKTLEDPPGQVLFFLITSQPEMLAETILSRCGILKFYPLNPKEMERYFKEKVPSSQQSIFFELSEGKPGRAIDFLKNPQKFLEVQKSFKGIEKIIKSDIAERFCFVKNFLAKKESLVKLNLFLEIFEQYLRKIFLEKLEKETNFLSGGGLEIKRMIEAVEKIKFLISKTNINPKLALETLMLMI